MSHDEKSSWGEKKPEEVHSAREEEGGIKWANKKNGREREASKGTVTVTELKFEGFHVALGKRGRGEKRLLSQVGQAYLDEDPGRVAPPWGNRARQKRTIGEGGKSPTLGGAARKRKKKVSGTVEKKAIRKQEKTIMNHRKQRETRIYEKKKKSQDG